ncbi:MAG: phosphotransferase enzyme family protein [Parahaliea sp.]
MDNFETLETSEQTRRLTELARTALQHWGFEINELQLIKFRENAVFRLLTTHGQQYALRIHRHGYHSDDALRSELQWMAALGNSGIEVPRVLPTRKGQLFTTAAVDSVPGERQVDLFTWVEGRQLGVLERDPGDRHQTAEVYRTIGELAAKLHNQAVDWRPPEGFTRHAWDADGLAGNRPLWGRFWELPALSPSQRELLTDARQRVHADLLRYGARPDNASRYSMIHADFVAENLLVEGSHVRLIDFDDAGFGWHLFELATALYFERGEPHFRDAYRTLVEGYRTYRDLPEEQLDYMPLFFAARGFTYLGWVATRPETETARTMTPLLIEMACSAAQDYFEAFSYPAP